MASEREVTVQRLIEAARDVVHDGIHNGIRADSPTHKLWEALSALSSEPAPPVVKESVTVAAMPPEGTVWRYAGKDHFRIRNGKMEWSCGGVLIGSQVGWRPTTVTLAQLRADSDYTEHPPASPSPATASVPTAAEVAEQIRVLPGVYITGLEAGRVAAIIDFDRAACRAADRAEIERLTDHGHKLIITQNAYVAELKGRIAALEAKLAAGGGVQISRDDSENLKHEAWVMGYRRGQADVKIGRSLTRSTGAAEGGGA